MRHLRGHRTLPTSLSEAAPRRRSGRDPNAGFVVLQGRRVLRARDDSTLIPASNASILLRSRHPLPNRALLQARFFWMNRTWRGSSASLEVRVILSLCRPGTDAATLRRRCA